MSSGCGENPAKEGEEEQEKEHLENILLSFCSIGTCVVHIVYTDFRGVLEGA